MGICLRSSAGLDLDLSPVFWQLLLAGPEPLLSAGVPALLAAIRQIDQLTADLCASLQAISQADFESLDLYFVHTLSDGHTEVELLRDGRSRKVAYAERLMWRDLVLAGRIQEAWPQIAAVRAALMQVVPSAGEYSLLQLLSWKELELRVCGARTIRVQDIKHVTKFIGLLGKRTAGSSPADPQAHASTQQGSTNTPREGGNGSSGSSAVVAGGGSEEGEVRTAAREDGGEDGEGDSIVEFFWRLLESYSQDQLKDFLKFVWARASVPGRGEPEAEGLARESCQLTVHLLRGNDHSGRPVSERLPSARTCFRELSLPVYPTYEMLRQKMAQALSERAGMVG
eukprot:gb/GEZN01008123.1/.p1 GENE.gb/GEZN01008123.1/~~gb/GEZN01008123.1/.p1  ORF type:complete len:400 (-),score=88.93 gb/GEZN01008123.1/:266-1288(-)